MSAAPAFPMKILAYTAALACVVTGVFEVIGLWGLLRFVPDPYGRSVITSSTYTLQAFGLSGILNPDPNLPAVAIGVATAAMNFSIAALILRFISPSKRRDRKTLPYIAAIACAVTGVIGILYTLSSPFILAEAAVCFFFAAGIYTLLIKGHHPDSGEEGTLGTLVRLTIFACALSGVLDLFIFLRAFDLGIDNIFWLAMAVRNFTFAAFLLRFLTQPLRASPPADA